jgi:hypothetical protein
MSVAALVSIGIKRLDQEISLEVRVVLQFQHLFVDRRHRSVTLAPAFWGQKGESGDGDLEKPSNRLMKFPQRRIL